VPGRANSGEYASSHEFVERGFGCDLPGNLSAMGVLLIALVLGAIALFVVGPATVVAAQDEDVDVETDGSPHLPGPGNPESGVS
jgi:hypothetical protein